MTLIDGLTLIYVIAFQACAVPAIVRIVRRQSSADLSVWREIMILVGVCAQFAVMVLTGAAWQVLISPVLSALNVAALLVTIRWFRA